MNMIERLLESFLPPGLIRDGLIGDLTELRARREARTGSTRTELWYVKELGFLSFAGGLSLFAKAVKQEILDELLASVGDRP